MLFRQREVKRRSRTSAPSSTVQRCDLADEGSPSSDLRLPSRLIITEAPSVLMTRSVGAVTAGPTKPVAAGGTTLSPPPTAATEVSIGGRSIPVRHCWIQSVDPGGQQEKAAAGDVAAAPTTLPPPPPKGKTSQVG